MTPMLAFSLLLFALVVAVMLLLLALTNQLERTRTNAADLRRVLGYFLAVSYSPPSGRCRLCEADLLGGATHVPGCPVPTARAVLERTGARDLRTREVGS